MLNRLHLLLITTAVLKGFAAPADLAPYGELSPVFGLPTAHAKGR
jgi:hypothetical protein